MAKQVWTMNQTPQNWHRALWVSCAVLSHPQEHRAGMKPQSQRGFWLKVMPSKHLQGCGGPEGSGAQPTSQMSTPRHCPPCCRGQNHWGERQRPAEHREHSSVTHRAGILTPGCSRGTLRGPKAAPSSAVQSWNTSTPCIEIQQDGKL